MYSFFQELRIKYGDNFFENSELLNELFSTTTITNLDIKRIYRFLDKNIKKDEEITEL